MQENMIIIKKKSMKKNIIVCRIFVLWCYSNYVWKIFFTPLKFKKTIILIELYCIKSFFLLKFSKYNFDKNE